MHRPVAFMLAAAMVGASSSSATPDVEVKRSGGTAPAGLRDRLPNGEMTAEQLVRFSRKRARRKR